ncbi:MAG: ATP phosphoribosyltransferase [Desulfurococcales archaeon]|nr:ATP phosphoribosyltransferase [Desulfurococcales archaeon]
MAMEIKIAVPSKGRLRDPTLRLLASAGMEPMYGPDRSLIVPTSQDDVGLVYIRPEDVPAIVYSGAATLGITGLDYVEESGVAVEPCLRLGYGRARLVLAVTEESPVWGPRDLEGARVATKFVSIARRYFQAHGVDPIIFRISGSAEAIPRLGAADAIIDVLSTGTTMRLHRLRPIDTVMETEAVLVARSCNGDEGVERVVESIRGVVNARGMRMVMMNVPGNRLREVLDVLPSMSGPAITRLESREEMWEVITAVPARILSKVIYEAKKRGARDIVVLSLERVIP